MSTIDLSRQITDPRKHYAGVRMQQGRVLTDDDFNEAAAIDAEELRRTRLHTIGAYGSPDAGFLPKDFAVVGGKLDFKLSAGNLYLGGLRLEMTADEHYVLQKDWLEFDPNADGLPAPADGQTRTDLVWISAWQQPVTAIEDSELFEVALGGPDTTTRWRTMRRVHVAQGVSGSDCADAWAEVSATFGPYGTMNDDMELATAATLTVNFKTPKHVSDLCSPPQPGGYLGAENQAIRVQMVDPTHYTWGFDDASPLYRCQLDADGVTLTLLNQPKDAVHWPLKNQVVELLAWSAVLANGEKVATLSGHLCQVLTSYNPDTKVLTLDAAPPANFGQQWKTRTDKGDFFDGKPEHEYFFLRVWNRGDDVTSPAAIPITTKDLGHTGLTVTFGGAPLRKSDYWIIAARPAAPDVVLPWVLMSGAPPNGIKRYLAPLGMIQWKTTKDPTTQVLVTTGTLVHDCRPPFLPLTRLRGCCSVTVGDGKESFGMFSSIQDAINSLPVSGGTVCILPGRHFGPVYVGNRTNVSLHGCGPRSRIAVIAEDGNGSTAIHVQGSSDVAIEHLAIEGGIGPVVKIYDDSSAVRLASCLIQMRNLRQFSPWPAVFVSGEMIEIEDNIIEILPKNPDDLDRIFHKVAAPLRAEIAYAARGGIQLAGGCADIRIAGNVIAGGTGNGITLGSLVRIDKDNPDGVDTPDVDEDDPCVICDPTDGGTPPDGGGVSYQPAGDLYAIDIDDNVITRHGANGIAVVRFFGFSAQNGLQLVSVHGLRITRNRIVRCLQRQVAQATSTMMLLLGYGGISLAYASGLEIVDNAIEGNGQDWLSPVCGVFALVVEGLDIDRNVIRDNGARSEEPVDSAQPGIRAGVHVWLAFSSDERPATSAGLAFVMKAVQPLTSDSGQVRIHGNRIEQPLGRALFMLGAGPMAITDNRFLSEGTGPRANDPIATTVLVGNFGISREWTFGLLMTILYALYGYKLTATGDEICQMATRARLSPAVWPRLPTGKLMFNDNQVTFAMQDAPGGFDLASALLVSLDDVAACDNQFEYETERRIVFADLLAAGSTVRTNDNRLAETWGRAVRSILSLAMMNTAADNQSTHCILALGLMRAVHHNLVLAQAFCDDACSNQRGVLGNVVMGMAMAGR